MSIGLVGLCAVKRREGNEWCWFTARQEVAQVECRQTAVMNGRAYPFIV